MTDLATLTVRLEAEISQYQTKLNIATKQIQKFQEDTKDSLDAFKDAFVEAFEIGAVYEFAKGVAEFAAQTIESVASLEKLSQSAGVSVEALSSLRLAAAASGVTQDELATSFKKLNVALSDANDPSTKAAAAFKSLGIEVRNADGTLKSVTQALPAIADAFKNSADGPTKAAIAVDLFGRAGVNMIPVLDGGSAALEEFRKKAEDAGLVISTETAQAAEEFTKKVNVLRESLIGGFSAQIEAQLLPVLDRLVDDFAGVGNSTSFLKEAAADALVPVKLIAEQLIIVGGVLKFLYQDAKTLFNVFVDIQTLDYGKIGQDLDAGFADAKATVAGTAKAVDDLWADGTKSAEKYHETAREAAEVKIDPGAGAAGAFDAFSGIDLSKIGEGLTKGLNTADAAVRGTFGDVVTGWKSADAEMAAYYDGVEKGSKTPITDPAVVSEQQKLVSEVAGADLHKVGASLGEGFAEAKAPVAATWDAATGAADAYSKQVAEIAKAPLTDPAIVSQHEASISGLTAAWKTSSAVVGALWDAASAAAGAYFDDVAAGSKTPIIDPKAVADQKSALDSLSGSDFSKLGQGLSDGFAKASAAVSATAAAVDDLWKSADAAAGSYFADVLAGSKTPITDPSVVADQQKLLATISDVDLAQVGEGLSAGFQKADAAVAATYGAIEGLWKSAGEDAASYFSVVLAGSKTPLIDPAAASDQAKVFDALRGANLGDIGKSLGDGFASAGAQVGATWKVAQDAATDYLAQVQEISKTPIVDSASVVRQEQDVGGLSAAWKSAGAVMDALWKSADAAASGYFDEVAAGSKTPIVDPSVAADQAKVFDSLRGTDLSKIGGGLSDGFARADAAVAEASAAVGDLWKNANEAATKYFAGVLAGSKTPVIDEGALADQRTALASLSGVDLSKLGAGFYDGFAKADAAVATTSEAVTGLWKQADALASSYFADVLAGSKTPIVNSGVLAEQQATLDSLRGVDLSKIGVGLYDGFSKADAAIADTAAAVDGLWKGADESATAYFASVAAGSKAPIVDPQAVSDGQKALDALRAVDLATVGESFSAGFGQANAAVAATTTAVSNLWKSADVAASGYFADVAAGSQLPIVDTRAVADAQKALAEIQGIDLAKVGRGLSDSFTAAKAPIASTWKVAQDAVADYKSKVEDAASTPIINPETVKDQAASVAAVGTSFRTATSIAEGLWEQAKAAASDYFSGVEAKAKTPIIDASVFAEQRKALNDLQNNTHLGAVGKDLTNALAESEQTLVLVSGQVDNLWKSAGDSAEGFFDKLRNAGSISPPQLVTTAQIQEQTTAQKKLEEFTAGIEAQAAAFGLGGAAATNFKLTFGPLGQAVALAHKNIEDMLAKGIVPYNKALLDSANATIAAAEASKTFSAQLQGEQDVKALKDFAAAIQQQVVSFDQGALASTNYRLSTGAIGEAVDRANKTLAEVPANTNAANDAVRGLATNLLTLVANARSASVALQAKQDTKEIDNYTAKLEEQLLKFGQSDVAAVDFATTTGKLGQALKSGSEQAIAATAHIHDLAVELTLAKDKEALFNVDQEILTMTGHLEEAAVAAFDFQNKLLIKNIAATGGGATQQQIEDLKKLGVSQEQYNEAVEKAQQAQVDYAATEAGVAQQVQAHAISAKAAQDELNAAKLKEHDILTQLAPVLEVGGQQQLATLGKLNVAQAQFNQLQIQYSTIQQAFSSQIERVSEQINSHQVDQATGQQKINQLTLDESNALQTVVDKMGEVASSSGLPALSAQTIQANENVKKLAASTHTLADQLKGDFINDFSDAFTSFITGTQSASQAWKSFVGNILSELIKLQTQKLLTSLLSGGSGDGFFSGLASAVAGGGKASGGRVQAGVSYTVGEHHAEEFVPDTDGTIVADPKWKGGGDTILNFNISAPNGQVSRATQQQIAASAASGLNRAGRRNN